MRATSNQPRRAYAAENPERGILKAQRADALLSAVCHVEGARVLEICTGAGYIAAQVAKLVAPRGLPHVVDVTDTRKIRQRYDLQLVDDTAQPCDDTIFDICNSNHIPEQVDDGQDQLQHWREIRCVLRTNGRR